MKICTDYVQILLVLGSFVKVLNHNLSLDRSAFPTHDDALYTCGVDGKDAPKFSLLDRMDLMRGKGGVYSLLLQVC